MLNPENKYLAFLGKNNVRYLRNTFAYFIRIFRRITLPGLDGQPLFSVLQFFIKGLFEGRLTTRASSISFDFFLALFPTILVFFTIIPFVPVKDFQPTLLQLMQEMMPKTLWPYVSSTLEEIIIRPRSDLLSLGFVLALYFSTNGVNSIMEGFNSTYHIIEQRSWIRQRMVSFLLVIVISSIVIVAITLLIVGGHVMDFLVSENILTDGLTIVAIQLSRWLLIIALFLFSISLLYYFAPAKKREFRFISAGSTLATFLMILSTYAFNFYIVNFSQYNALYGSIGTLLIFLLYVNFNSIIILIGFELNASISSAKSASYVK